MDPRPPGAWSQEELVSACVEVVRAAMTEEREIARHAFDPWPVVGSLVLEPAVVYALMAQPRGSDTDGFWHLAARLAMPAGLLCGVLALRSDSLRERA
jgi:hypothetical protein